MASEKQTEANRRNAQKSTGPRTGEGKRKSRLNAFKHGLTGQLDIMDEEQREARDTFIARLVIGFNPVGPLENHLAHSIADSYWRMQRTAIVEDALLAEGDYVQFEHNQDKEYSDLTRALSSVRAFAEHPERFNLLTVYEMRLHRKAQADLKQLREIQTERRALRKEKAAAAQPAEIKVDTHENGFVCSTPPDGPPAVSPPVTLLNQSQPQAFPENPDAAIAPAPTLVMHSAESARAGAEIGFDFSAAEVAAEPRPVHP